MTSELERATINQGLAAAPERSAFVAANAGSGKTRVLTNRVARLLLAGADPSTILCITFTKAAAAEMAHRLFDMLGEWALMADDRLAQALTAVGAPIVPGAAGLGEARRLFARALETPGGLKIQTIHSFCETVLKRFPLEAGVAPGFRVIEESAARALAERALDDVVRRPGLARDAATRLAVALEAEAARRMIADAVGSRLDLERELERAGGWEGLAAAAAAGLGAAPGRTEAQACSDAAAVLSREAATRARDALLAGGSDGRKLAHGPLTDFIEQAEDGARVKALLAYFFTGKGGLRKSLADRAARASDPGIAALLEAAQTEFSAAFDRMKAATMLEDAMALHRLTAATVARYDALKAAQAGLDFDDLVIRVRRLFRDPDQNAWVLYKLDNGLSHILLDEAQDTGPAPWDIVEGPLTEFFSGEARPGPKRTFFAVGDQKQSIYSFQGADAGLFDEKRVDLGKAIEAADPDFLNLTLPMSFRTTEPVLAFVDALFDDRARLLGLGEDDGAPHDVNRRGEAGGVEVWPPAPRAQAREADAWDAPLDATTAEDPLRRLCGAVAATVRRWLADGERLESRGRAIRPEDVLILVQRRGAIFHTMIGALGRLGVPVAGADRLKLLDDPAVQDLLAYARAALLEADDLSFAELMKSPFFGFDDEALFAVAHARTGTLAEAVRKAATGDGLHAENCRRMAEEFAAAREVGRREGAYAFFAHVLEAGAMGKGGSGRRRLYARLGEAAREPVDELLRQALDFEARAPRSLQGFISEFSATAGEIKREADQESRGVRVMTVHGAKGLEAEIVFLLDAHVRPRNPAAGVFRVAAGAGAARAPAVFRRMAEASELALAARSEEIERRYEEYRRLLYVAATRARDRLYVCSVAAPANRKQEDDAPASQKTWAGLADAAFDRLQATGREVERAPFAFWEGEVRRLACPQTVPSPSPRSRENDSLPPAAPWISAPAPAEPRIRLIAPSRFADAEEAGGADEFGPAEPSVQSPTNAIDAYRRGRAIHRLLELLPTVTPDRRAGAGDRVLARLAPDVDAQSRALWRDEALRVLCDPCFSDAFGPASRAEVGVAGRPKGARADVVINGRIDRLAVFADRALVVDFKTNRPPPARVEDIAAAYLAQMAAYRALIAELYPDRRIETALLWTFAPRLTPLPDALLDHAFERLLT